MCWQSRILGENPQRICLVWPITFEVDAETGWTCLQYAQAWWMPSFLHCFVRLVWHYDSECVSVLPATKQAIAFSPFSLRSLIFWVESWTINFMWIFEIWRPLRSLASLKLVGLLAGYNPYDVRPADAQRRPNWFWSVYPCFRKLHEITRVAASVVFMEIHICDAYHMCQYAKLSWDPSVH